MPTANDIGPDPGPSPGRARRGPRPKTLVVLGILAVALLVAPSAALAAPREHVVVSGDVTVPKGQTVGNVVIVDGPVVVAGHVTGEVVALHGSVTISGVVDGNVTAVSEKVRLLEGARVGGDLLFGGDRPGIARGARVNGKVSDEGWADLGSTGFVWALRLLFWLAVSVSTIALGLGLIALAPRAGDAAWRVASEQTGPAAAWAMGLFLGLPIAALFAIGTLLGLPFGVGLMLALVPLAAVGYVTSGLLLGGLVLRRPGPRIKAFLVGWGILRIVALVPVLGAFAWVAASAFGLAVLLLAAWRAGRSPVATAPPMSRTGAAAGVAA